MLKSIWNKIHGLRCIYVFLFCVTPFHAANNWKSLNHEISHEKKHLTHKTLTRKNFEPTKYLRQETLHPRNTYKKIFRIHEKPTKAWWHGGTRPTRPTMAHDPLNLAHSIMCNSLQIANNNFCYIQTKNVPVRAISSEVSRITGKIKRLRYLYLYSMYLDNSCLKHIWI